MDTEGKKIYRTYPGRIGSGRKNPDRENIGTVLHNYLRVNTLPLICMIYRWIIMATREQCRDLFPLPLHLPLPHSEFVLVCKLPSALPCISSNHSEDTKKSAFCACVSVCLFPEPSVVCRRG